MRETKERQREREVAREINRAQEEEMGGGRTGEKAEKTCESVRARQT